MATLLEKLFNFLFQLGDVFSRTSDPVLAEYRGYQRQFIICIAVAFAAFVCSYVITPSTTPDGSLRLLAALPAAVGLALDVISLLASIWGLWIGYCLWRFVRDI